MAIRLAALLLLLGCAAGASAQITISKAWVRAVPPVSGSTAAYFVLRNSGDEDVVLEGAKANVAGQAMLHETVSGDHGTTTMKHIDSLKVPAGGEVRFTPGKRHLMLMHLKRVPVEGEKVRVCLKISGKLHCQPFPVLREAPE